MQLWFAFFCVHTCSRGCTTPPPLPPWDPPWSWCIHPSPHHTSARGTHTPARRSGACQTSSRQEPPDRQAARGGPPAGAACPRAGQECRFQRGKQTKSAAATEQLADGAGRAVPHGRRTAGPLPAAALCRSGRSRPRQGSQKGGVRFVNPRIRWLLMGRPAAPGACWGLWGSRATAGLEKKCLDHPACGRRRPHGWGGCRRCGLAMAAAPRTPP